MTIKKPLDPFKTAALFIGKKDVRNRLNFIYSDGETLTASDGSALIVIQHQAAPGYYDKNGQKIALESRYPRFEKVFNSCTKAEPVDLATEAAASTPPYGLLSLYEAKYIKALQKIGVTTAYTVEENNTVKLYYENDNFKGVILPRFVF